MSGGSSHREDICLRGGGAACEKRDLEGRQSDSSRLAAKGRAEQSLREDSERFTKAQVAVPDQVPNG